MAKDTNKIVDSNIGTMSLIVVALLVLVSIVYYAWSTKPADSTTKPVTETTTDTANAADVDKLGPLEVKLTPENFTEVTTKNKLVLADIYSPTCIYCQRIAPILTELSNEYGDKLVVGKMSMGVDGNREYIINFDKDLKSVPALYIFKDGVRVESFTGGRTKAEFKTMIDKYLN